MNFFSNFFASTRQTEEAFTEDDFYLMDPEGSEENSPLPPCQKVLPKDNAAFYLLSEDLFNYLKGFLDFDEKKPLFIASACLNKHSGFSQLAVNLSNIPNHEVDVDGEYLSKLTREHPDMEALILAGCTNITCVDLAVLWDVKETLKVLNLRDTNITNRALRQIVNLQNITCLNLSNTDITDSGLQKIIECKNLRWLNLAKSAKRNQHITNVILLVLNKLTKLEDLNLSWAHITLEGLYALRDLKNLKVLTLINTPITPSL